MTKKVPSAKPANFSVIKNATGFYVQEKLRVKLTGTESTRL